jgi:hypothetical protein
MKKILSLILCMMLLFALPVAVFAEEAVETEPTVSESSFDTEKIVEWVQAHFEEISVVVSLLLYTFYQATKNTALGKSVGTLNNNAVAVAENSKLAIDQALAGMSSVNSIVTDYIGKMDKLLEEVRTNEEDKRAMKAALDTAMKYVESAKSANLEFANEFAELLNLANIPNSKKEELYARHRAAVEAIASVVSVVGGNKEETKDEETEE